MRAVLTGFAVAALVSSAGFAATKLAPKEIQTEFFDGKPFAAATTSGTKFKLTFSPDGKVTREPQDKAGQKGRGPGSSPKRASAPNGRAAARTATRSSMSTRTNGRW